MRRFCFFLLAALLIAPPEIHFGLLAQDTGLPDSSLSPSYELTPDSSQSLEAKLEGPMSAEQIAGANSWANSIGIADWLGPLAPVALSPFFGVTCLSGLALWGPQWATDNVLLGESSPLQNPTFFFVLLGLTILTSVPRLTKVSKPFAQAVDRLETYAVIIILLAIKITMSMETEGEVEVAVVHLGILSLTADTLLAVAMVINILVINSVKFFFEFLVWLTPVPFLDALFEVCNKSLCAVLMAVYAFSPTLATVINLGILLVAAFLLRWMHRRARFYRRMVLDPLLSRIWPSYAKPKHEQLIVFPVDDMEPFPEKSQLVFKASDQPEGGWELHEANWWMPQQSCQIAPANPPHFKQGWIMNTLTVQQSPDGKPIEFRFSRRYDRKTLETLLAKLGVKMGEEDSVMPTTDDRKAEFA